MVIFVMFVLIFALNYVNFEAVYEVFQCINNLVPVLNNERKNYTTTLVMFNSRSCIKIIQANREYWLCVFARNEQDHACCT